MTTTQVSIPGYKFRSEIYNGSRALVYHAFREIDGASVVIKLLKNPYPSFGELVQFRNQYTIAKNLNFLGIIQTYSLESFQNGYMLVMEDFGGISLKDYLTQIGVPYISSNQEFLQIAISLCDTLDILYRHKIIHKDIKPSNILINPETKQVKLIDFSIASLLPRETQSPKNPHVLEGTLSYLSPEQTGRMNRGIDYRTDLYSLGVTFYELLSGKLPFQSSDPMELVHCHIAKIPPRLGNREQEIGNEEEIPQVFGDIIMKLMAKNAEDRYQSALGLKHDLEKCLYEIKDTGKIEFFEIAKKDICDRFIIPDKLYGRKAEVATLLNAFERVSQGSSELMMVAGFSGIGKTAVVNEVHKPIVQQRGYFIKGKFDQFNRNIPFSAFVQAFRDLIVQLLTESDVQIKQWKNSILEAVGENGQVIIEVIPELEKIIGQQPSVLELSGIAAQNRFNLLFQKFLKVFTNQEHPLVVFLDDLQWADSASLNLVQLLMGESQTNYLLMIGAYRDNEVFSVHPLILMLDEVEKRGTVVNTITLAQLSEHSVSNLVADTLNSSENAVQSLTELIYQKTQGNPFFCTQFLKALHQDGLVTFNPQEGWQCNITKVREAALTDDVVEFMSMQLQKLPTATQEILKLAACISNQFDLSTLAIISEKSEIEIATDLWSALQTGLILPQTEIYKFYQEQDNEQLGLANHARKQLASYKFLHDRVQQACYSLISENQKQASHLSIGRLLLEASSVNPESDIFQIVNQFNQCLEIIDCSDEILTIAKLNCIAATKARETTAFATAREYAWIGISLLGEDAWQTNYDLILALRNCLAEAAYLSGSFDLMNDSIADILNHAYTLEDRLGAYEIKLQALKAQNHLQEAIDLGLKILNLLEISLPKDATPSDIEQGFKEMEAALQGRPISELINLPKASSRAIKAASRILASLCPVAHMAQFNLLPILLFQQVQLALRYGNAPAHTHAYAGLGIILCSFREDIERGYEAGQLALALLDRIEAEAFRAASTFVATYFTLPWKTSIQSTFHLMLKAYTSGVNTGDLEHAAYALERYGQLALFSGAVELSYLETQMDEFTEFMRKQHQDSIVQIQNITHQAVLNLQGKSKYPFMLVGAVYDEKSVLPQHLKENNRLGLIYYYLHKLILIYLFADDSQAAVDYATQGIQYLDGGSGSIILPLFHTYDSLARFQNYGYVLPEKQQQYLTEIDANQKKIKNWAFHAPMNYLHKYELVEAERYRVLGNKAEAVEMYERAISGARINGYIQEEALANELAAKFYLAWGKEKAAVGYMQQAYYCYAKWGAKAKIDDLEKRYPQLLQPILQQQHIALNPQETLAFVGSSLSTSTSSIIISDALDFTSILKAAQTISSSIELDKLVTNLTQIILENSGAKKSALILSQEDTWQVRAITFINQLENSQSEIQTILVSQSIDTCQDIPIKIINYVKNTLETVVIDNCQTNIPGIVGEYMRLAQPQSVLCTPIINQGRLIGILYLENQLTSGVFTNERLQVINLLSSQAAISLENARLYQQAQQALLDLQQAQLQIVQSEKMSALGNLVAGVAHEINNPLGFIVATLQQANNSVNDILEHLKLYQEAFPNSSEKIIEHSQEIDLDYTLQDLQKMIDTMIISCDRLENISTSLRTFSRTDRDYKVKFKLHEGINSTILILKHRLKANEQRPAIEVVTNYGNLPEIQCFPGQLNQVFMNILANAIDALDESNIGRSFEEIKANPNRITIKTSVEDNQVKVSIADNGKGMSEEIKQKIFDYLFTTKVVGKGTGLGLAIAKQIVEKKHSGKIEVNSVWGEGTEFKISLFDCLPDRTMKSQ